MEKKLIKQIELGERVFENEKKKMIHEMSIKLQSYPSDKLKYFYELVMTDGLGRSEPWDLTGVEKHQNDIIRFRINKLKNKTAQ